MHYYKKQIVKQKNRSEDKSEKDNPVLLRQKSKVINNLLNVTNSYLGHFKHADSYKLINEQINKNDILVNVLKFENERFIIKDNCKDRFYNLYTQYQYFKKRYPNHLIFFKTGCYYEFYGKQAIIVNILFGCKFLKPRKSFELNGLYHRAGIYENCFYKYFKICLDNNIEIIRVNQKGLLAGNIKKREIDLKFNLNLGLI